MLTPGSPLDGGESDSYGLQMTNPQRQHWDMLLEVDESSARFTRKEIDFVAGLIDAKPSKQGRLTEPEMAQVRALYRSKVERATDEDDDL